MPRAALYDIHGNLPALRAVLEEARALSVDQIVVGGDVIPGPMPNECLDLLANLDLQVSFIRGNCELEVLHVRGGESRIPEPFAETMRWTAERLTPAEAALIEKWPRTHRETIPGVGSVLFCHATPRDENEVFTKITPAERLAAAFDTDADVVVCGHTHMQFDRMVGSVRVLNAGSVGMPFQPRGAYWLLFDGGVQLRHTLYDFESAAQAIRGTDFPMAEQYAQDLLQPPPEEERLELYESFAMKDF